MVGGVSPSVYIMFGCRPSPSLPIFRPGGRPSHRILLSHLRPAKLLRASESGLHVPCDGCVPTVWFTLPERNNLSIRLPLAAEHTHPAFRWFVGPLARTQPPFSTPLHALDKQTTSKQQANILFPPRHRSIRLHGA